MAALSEGLASFDAFLALERGLAPKTLEAYGRDVRFFAEFLRRERNRTDCAAIARADVVAYLERLRAMRRRPATRARAFTAVRTFLRHLHEQRYAPHDVSEGLEAPKKDLVLPKVLSEDAVARLVTSVDGAEVRDVRDRAMLELLYDGGFRVSEVCALETADVRMDDHVIVCRGKGSKERIVPITVAAGRALDRYLAAARGAFAKSLEVRPLFLTRLGRAFTRQGVFKMLKERAAAAGLDPAVVSPHVLRHCFATHLLAHGADIRAIQELLGHASIGTTQMYTHVDATHLRDIHTKYHPRA